MNRFVGLQFGWCNSDVGFSNGWVYAEIGGTESCDFTCPQAECRGHAGEGHKLRVFKARGIVCQRYDVLDGKV